MAVEDEDIIVHAGEENPKHLPLGSLDEIRSRRRGYGLCSLVAGCLDQKPSDAAGTWCLIEHTEICSFELPDGVHDSDPAVTHFHYTRPSILFDPSSMNNFQGPVLPWESKNASKKRAQGIIEFKIKANNKGNSTSRSEEQYIIDGVGGRQVTEQVDANLLKTWLHLCEKHHGPQCREPMRFPSTQETGPALVIDVTESCIIETPMSCRYFALSYVWGSAAVFRHLKKKLREDSEAGLVGRSATA
ncbi:hypothetical protein IWX90DRAFT_416687 [Phyllosticta citrichinensis]|uniref:Uncharacterized protein n=1 Tax=Phyllosticta citrichinensis TaxID=1130410 RepID=A0ABR1XNA4_9PEZI